MSYSMMSNCYACAKRATCTDEAKIQEGINKIHENCLGEGGHEGSGSIILFCSNLEQQKNDPQ